MEEKERYSLFIGQCCVDKEDKNKLINGLDRLNQQDKRIKELKQENQQLKEQLTNAQKEYQEYREVVTKDIEKEVDERMRDTIKEFHLDIKQLKQSQKQLAIEELENLKKEFYSRKLEYKTMENSFHIYGLRIDRIFEIIDDQIKELKGE